MLRRTVLAATLAALTLVCAPSLAGAATYTVDNLADTPAGNPCAGVTGCTLRGAVEAANASPGADVLELAGGTHALMHGTLAVTEQLTIRAASASGPRPVIDAMSAFRVLNVSAVLVVEGVDVVRGMHTAPTAQGGAILTSSALTLSDVTVADSGTAGTASGAEGGAVAALGGTLTVTGSRFLRNSVAAAAGDAMGGALYVGAGATATVTDSQFVDNGAAANPAANAAAAGGAVRSAGASLAVVRSQFVENRAESGIFSEAVGGAVSATGATLSVSETVVRDNEAVGTLNGRGGGIAWIPAGAGTFAMGDSHVAGNDAEGGAATGGGVYAQGTTSVAGSTFAANRALTTATPGNAQGGGLYVGAGALDLRASTVHGNVARGTLPSTVGSGGGLWVSSAATVTASTITANTSEGVQAALGGGLGGMAAATVTLGRSILAGNAQGDPAADCATVQLTSAGGNVVNQSASAPTCPLTPAAGDVVAADPQLGPLGDHGGPAPTVMPLAGSPAVDRTSASCGGSDQRGVARPQGAACDAGAVEARPAAFSAAPGALAFDPLLQGTTSAAKTLTLTNDGELAAVPAVTVTGGGAASFVLDAAACASSVAPGGSCALGVRFAPAAAGALAATLAGLTAPVDLSGSGLAPVEPDPDPEPQPRPETPAPAPAPAPAPVVTRATPPAPPAACRSRRNFTLRLELSRRIRTARVTVDGRAARLTRIGGRLIAAIDLRGRPRATVQVRIVARTKGGKVVRETRSYRTCLPPSASGGR